MSLGKKLALLEKNLTREELIVVDKIRKNYMFNEKYEVGLDKVENLVFFVEIKLKKVILICFLKKKNLYHSRCNGTFCLL